jgi:hypothetical protein
MIGFRESTIEGEAELLERDLPHADVLIRRGVEPTRLLDDLEAALQEKLGMAIEVGARSEARPTLVLRGSLHALAPDSESPDQLPAIELHPTAQGLAKGGGLAKGTNAVGRASTLLPLILAAAAGMPVVDETRDAMDMVNVRLHHGPGSVRDLEEVLRELTATTGLEVAIESRTVEIVSVSEEAETADL